MKLRLLTTSLMSVAIACAITMGAQMQELAVNGGFEAGDTSGWQYFSTPSSTFNVTNDAASGAFAGELFNSTLASDALIKQANVGVGVVNPGDTINISFDAKGDFVAGGVFIAEFFSEVAGGGTSATEILGGGPLFVSNQTMYQSFSFQTTAGPDVSGGVTLQLKAGTGGAGGSTAVLFIDNVSIVRVPEPGSAALLGLGGLGMLFRRRRA